MEKEYEKLKSLSQKIKILESITHLLDWDQETMMPSKGINIRSKQNAELALIIHQKKTSKSYETALNACINIKSGKIKVKGIDSRQSSCLNLLREDYLKAKKLPAKFVKELAELRSISTQIWAKAKEENRFEDFSPYLDKMIDLMRKQADYLGYEDHPYDALIDLYEPKMTVKSLDKLFKPLKEGLIDITDQIYSQKKPSTSILNRLVAEEVQLKFCRSLLKILGLDENTARLDTSSHPFCNSICPSDVRLTTHIKSNNIFNAISSTLHEFGHALYEAGIPEEEFGLPLGESCSLGVHESQSRLFETFIGQGKHFIHLLKDKLIDVFPNLDVNELYEAINLVEPSFIRIESDEVTYCLHILLRYELEKQLIEGKLKAKDLPKAWNEAMSRYLGITPPNDQKGCLQDIHWSMGLFGYFPTYALGNLYAAQIFERLHLSIKDFENQIAQGHFTQITSWLHNHIYRFGREKAPEELIKNATHKALGCEAYLSYLNQKYLKT